MRCLDCRVFSQSMLSVTEDPNIAARFCALRKSTGEQHIGKLPPNTVTVQCDLSYPYSGEIKDGPLFIAEEMEDKWDI